MGSREGGIAGDSHILLWPSAGGWNRTRARAHVHTRARVRVECTRVCVRTGTYVSRHVGMCICTCVHRHVYRCSYSP